MSSKEIAAVSKFALGKLVRRFRQRQAGALLFVLALTAALRAWKLTDWSLWEDEETTIYFSQQLAKPFPRYSPVFFALLNRWFAFTGVSVGAGRMLSAAIGVLGVAVAHGACRRIVSPSAALWGALLLALNLGHLFWSQSIRYFGLLFVFEVLSLYWFYCGFERRKPWLLILANAAFALALWTHFSALLIVPVFIGYLLLASLWAEGRPPFEVSLHLAFIIPLSAVIAVFAKDLLAARSFLNGMPLASARDPLHIITTIVAYIGLPVLGLAIMAPWASGRVWSRAILFLSCCAFVPFAELLVIAQLNLVNVTWYYGIIALFGVAALAGLTLSSLAENGRTRLAAVLRFTAIGYAATLLFFYFSTMHGDRPRWREAADYLRQVASIDPGQPKNPSVFANVPGVVAFYLGVNPGETMTDGLVRMAPAAAPLEHCQHEQWFVLEAGSAAPALSRWLDAACERKASFAARTGPKDRTITIYRFPGRTASQTERSAKLP